MVLSLKQKIAVICTIALVLIVTAVTVAVVLLKVKNHQSDGGCAINPFVNELPPLITISGQTSLIYPEWGSQNLKFDKNEAVDFICPEGDLFLGASWRNSTLTSGYCDSGTEFRIDGVGVDWRDLRCSTPFWRTIRKTNTTCASNAGTILEAGFEVGDGRFITTLTICFNEALQTAFWTFINQTASINQQVLDTPRPSWLQGSGTFTIGYATDQYYRATQRATINGLLGLKANSTKYIQSETNYFLARGHLTGRGDGFYAAQKNATFFMENIAPQWQTFNRFNWNEIEITVREYADANGVDLMVWSGVHGVATLPHEQTQEPTKLYLFVNSTTKVMPVPEIYYKVVYNLKTEKGVVLIGVNNPFLSNITKLCPDVSNSISWIQFDKGDQQMGLCYACRITSFKYEVLSLPSIVDRGLML